MNCHSDHSLYTKKWGVFTHYLYAIQNNAQQIQNQGAGETDWNDCVDSFDTERFAKTLHESGANYLFFTIMQGTQYLIAPNSMFDQISGYQPGEACSRRDLIEDLYQSLSKYDIDLYLYYTGDGPWKDNKAGKAFGFTAPRENVPREFVERWASVLKEYSQRYGNKVKGWWIDGCYTYFGYNDDLMKCYVDAVKTGNPEALIALNGGVRDPVIRYSKYDDFTCGELNDFIYLPQDRFIDGAQAHILAPLGVSSREDGFDGWCKPGVKRSKEYMRDYVKTVNTRGGVVTIDVCLYRNGSIDLQQLEVLKHIKNLSDCS